MNNKNVIVLKLYENDFYSIQMIVMEHIRKMRSELNKEDLNEETRKLIEKTLNEDKTLMEKLNICKLYNQKNEDRDFDIYD